MFGELRRRIRLLGNEDPVELQVRAEIGLVWLVTWETHDLEALQSIYDGSDQSVEANLSLLGRSWRRVEYCKVQNMGGLLSGLEPCRKSNYSNAV